MQAQSVISSALGSGSTRFDARRSGAGWEVSGGGVTATLTRGRIGFRAVGGTLSMRLTGVGRGAQSTPAPPTAVLARANRITIERGGVGEWYAAGPLGIEQGFTVGRRPAGQGAWLTLTLGLRGTARAQMSVSDIRFVAPEGRTVLRYGGLDAVDASGRHLRSGLAVRAGRLLVHVDDRGARYPITVDPLVQQGAAITANDESGGGNGSQMGQSVAVSADGDTALVGGGVDHNDLGAAWVFRRVGSTWIQQGRKLVPSDHSGNSSEFGISVALSADGNTALIGGSFDDTNKGAAWVFTRTASTWTQRTKLTGAPGENGSANFGQSVALSGDGTVALVGGPADNNGAGAAWLFTGSGSTWVQRQEINPPDRFPASLNTISGIGTGVALSSNGNVALIGGPQDNGNGGSVWVYTRPSQNATTWTEAKKILTPLDEVSPQASGFGNAIALSSDGSTALIGGDDDGSTGAAWVFTGAGANWNEQAKLTGNGVNGAPPNFGNSVSISSDGNTAAVGANQDDGGDGAVFLFARSGANWTQLGSRLKGAGATRSAFGTGVALASDGNTLMVGAPLFGNSQIGAMFAFSPPDPVCSSVAATGPQGGGAVAVSLSCTLPAGAHPVFSVLGGPSNGSLSGLNGSTGSLVYTSRAFFSGQDSFTYHVADQWGLSNTATATVTVPGLPVPTCANVRARGAKAATRVTVRLRCSGPVGHRFSYALVSQPGDGKLGPIDQSTGRVTYKTHVGFSGSDRFVYEAIDAGGASAPATATITIPRLPHITSSMTWQFIPQTKSTVVRHLVVQKLPRAATVKLACVTRRCSIRARSRQLAKQRVCKRKGKGKGKKRKCHRVRPASGTIDLSKFVAGKRVKVGTVIKVSIFEPGAIGKQFTFKIRANRQPAVIIGQLEPGSLKPCPRC
jgi:hypothetical protein